MDGSSVFADDAFAAAGDFSRCIELIDGQPFDPVNPTKDGITRENIIAGLSHTCRFGGQISSFYSVGQHVVLVAFLTHENLSADIVDQKAAILHDGDECFGLPDMPKPLKAYFPHLVVAQHQLGRMIFEVFNVDHDREAYIKPADSAALVIEKRALKPNSSKNYWKAWPSPLPDPGVRVQPLGPMEAKLLVEDAFHRIFDEGKPIDRTWLLAQPGFE